MVIVATTAAAMTVAIAVTAERTMVVAAVAAVAADQPF
jgi:hypothetical protein